MKKQLLVIVCNIVVLLLAVYLFPAITYASIPAIIGMGVLVWVANLIVKPLLLVITLPLNVLTFGLMGLVVNTWTLRIAAGLTKGFSFPNFWTAFLTAGMISLAHLCFVKQKETA